MGDKSKEYMGDKPGFESKQARRIGFSFLLTLAINSRSFATRCCYETSDRKLKDI